MGNVIRIFCSKFGLTFSDDVESFQLSGLPEHLVSMITILLEEERRAIQEGQRTFQPCLEFFMQNKIMETLALLGAKNVCHKDQTVLT
jgi:hypothetical protein